MAFAKYTAPGLTLETGKELSNVLQARLHDLNDLHLILKHAHWNVTGPGFIAVHEMIDPQVDTVREFVDAIAERMATLGATPTAWLVPWSHSAPLRTTPLIVHALPTTCMP